MIILGLLAAGLVGCGVAGSTSGPARDESATATGSPAATAVESGAGSAEQSPTGSMGSSAGSPTQTASPSTPPPPWIDSVTWTTTQGKPRLSVVLVDDARVYVSHEHAMNVWQQVLDQAPDADVPGMAEQFECHLQFATGKQRYNLEPWRPAVSYPQTVLAGCNPGEAEVDP